MAPPADSPKQIHKAVLIAAVGRPVTVVAKCSRIGATMNAATARSNSSTANPRWMLAERSENPARNRAGATEAPMPTPTSPDPTRVSADGAAEQGDPGSEEDHPGQGEDMDQARAERRPENDGGDHGRAELGDVEQAQVQRRVVGGEHGPGQGERRRG